MLNRFFTTISSKPKVQTAVVMIVLALIFWLVAPYIHWGHTYPFSIYSARLLWLALAVLACMAKICIDFLMKHKLESWNKLKSIGDKSSDFLKLSRQRMVQFIKEKHADARKSLSQGKDNRELHKLPIYLVMGSQSCGKNTLIQASGQRLLTPSFYGRKAELLVKTFDAFNWYFSDEAIFVVTSDLDKDEATHQFRSLVHYLRKKRKAKPIGGVLLLFSLPELFLARHQSRHAYIKGFCDHVKMLHKMLKAPIPVYTVLCKCDLVSGFTEFFSNLSKEDLLQVWGVTFPLKISSSPSALVNYFSDQYILLVNRLHQRALLILDNEKKQKGRNLSYNFPQQINFFGTSIAELINELFSPLIDIATIQMRGVYLTSSIQVGESYDFVGQAIFKRFQIEHEKNHALHQNNESYFIYKLFQDVIIPESKILGYSERSKRLKNLLYRTTYLAIPSVFLCASLATHSAYKRNEESIFSIQGALDTYNHSMRQLRSDDASLESTLPTLNSLRVAERSVDQTHGSHLLLSSYLLSLKIRHSLDRSLHTLYLPRVAAQLENILDSRSLSSNALYATLKGYLAFSPEQDTQASAIVAPMKLEWVGHTGDDAKLKEDLEYYLARSSKLRIDQLPLNHPLINKVRLSLQQVIPSTRAYALLSIKSMASDVADLVFSSVVGEKFSEVFQSQGHNDVVPALYTEKGFTEIYQANSASIAHQVSTDNKAIGLKSHSQHTQSYQGIMKDMGANYNHAYQLAWKRALESIHLVKIDSFDQASQIFSLLSSDQSPMTKLLNIIYANTYDIHASEVNVSQVYALTNAFSQSAIGRSDWSKTQEAYQSVSDMLVKLSQTSDIDQASFDMIKSYMVGDDKNPLRTLAAIAEHSPWPLHGWLKGLNDQVWHLLMMHAKEYINEKWQHDVWGGYRMMLNGRFPLVANSPQSISMSSFNQFYAPKGKVNVFYETFIKSFVHVKKGRWLLAKVHGYGFNLEPSTLELFQHVDSLSNVFFGSDKSHAQLSFSIAPSFLSNNASHMQLIMGGKHISYAHGPQKMTAFQWPFEGNAAESKFILSDFEGHRRLLHFYGPWSIFRLIKNGYLKELSNHSAYLLSFYMGKEVARWKIISDAPLSAFNLNYLSQLRLPHRL